MITPPTTSPSASTLTGKVTPDITQSGENITIEAFTGPETTSRDVVIMGVTYQLTKQADETWKLIYAIPDAPDGSYPVLLTATDNNGTQKNTTLSLTIDNTPPQLDALLTPELVRTGNVLTITATTSSDAEKVTAVIFGETLKLKKQSPNSWMLRYAVPNATDGSHNIQITATDKAGNQAQTTLNFTVDNTPPTLNPTINQTLVKSGDKITITTTADNDTQSVKAYIQDNTYQLTKNQDNTWSMEYTTPQIGDGVYSIILIAWDMVGNTNHTPLTFTVDNTPPVINPEISPEAAKPGENITITVTASSDTQNVVAIIGTQRTTLNYSNGTWTTTYTIPLDSTFDIHTMRIEGTDTVGNVGKNIASYEVLDPNTIPPWFEDLINPDTPTNIPIYTNNPGPGNTGGSNGPGSGTIGGNDQLYRDQMYIRNTLTPPKDSPNGTSPPKQEMPGWNIDTSLIPEILIASAMLATSAVAARFLHGETKDMENRFGKWAVENLGVKDPGLRDFILFGVSIGIFVIDPTLLDAIMIFLTIAGIWFDFIYKMMFSGTMQIFGYFLLAVAIIKLVKKYFGLDIVQMATDKLGKFNEIIIDKFKPIIDRLKEMVGLK